MQASDSASAGGGADPSAHAEGDWRAQIQPEGRSRVVNKIMETLKKHLPVSVPDALNELQKIAVRFEEKIYAAATDQCDYLRKISLKMLSMETKSQQKAPGHAEVIPNQNNPGQGQAHDSNISRQHEQQPHQSLQQHGSPQASLSSMSTGLQSSSSAGIRRHVPATNFSARTQRNGANMQHQAGSNSEMRATVNGQLRAGSSSSMLSHISGQRKHIMKRRWRETF